MNKGITTLIFFRTDSTMTNKFTVVFLDFIAFSYENPDCVPRLDASARRIVNLEAHDVLVIRQSRLPHDGADE